MSHTSLCRWEDIESGEDGEASCLKVDQVPGGCSCKSSSVYCAAVGLHCSPNRRLMRMLLINRCCVCSWQCVSCASIMVQTMYYSSVYFGIRCHGAAAASPLLHTVQLLVFTVAIIGD